MSNPDERDALTKLDGLYGGCFLLDDDGNIHAVHTSVRDALIEIGVIWRERDGTWRIANENTNIIEDKRPDLAICDFCSARPVLWDVKAEDFEFDGQTSVGGWAACEECGQHIAANRRQGLLDRSLDAHRRLADSDYLREWHRRFWSHYKGIARVMLPRHFGH